MQNEEEIEPFKPEHSSKSYESTLNRIGIDKMLRTEKFGLFAILVLVVLTLGISTAIFGLSLIEFSQNIHVTIGQLTYGVFLKFIFCCLGSLAASYCLDRWNRQLQFAFHNIFLGALTIIFPLCTSFALYLFISALQGFVFPFINTIPSVWIIELFGDSSKIYLQIYHFFYPIGQLIGPLMTAPFLRNGSGILNSTNSSFDANDDQNSFFENLFATTKYSKLWIPYLVVTSLNLIGGLLVIFAYLLKPYQKPTKKEVADNSESNVFEDAKRNLSKNYTIVFVALICLITGIQLSNEINGISFLPTYLVKSNLKLDQETAAYCQAVLSSATTVGRFVNIFLTIRIGIQSMLFINFISMILGNIFIMTMGNYSLNGIYIGAVLLGYGFSNAFPMIISLVEERINMSNKIMAYMNLSSGLCIAISSITLGEFLDSNPTNYVILNLVLTLIAFFTYCVLFTLEYLRLSKKNLSK